jgi:hypothetical protein
LLSLTLSSALGNTSFLSNGSYVEFGSDYLFVQGTLPPPPPPVVPEPTSIVLLGSGIVGVIAKVRNRRR